MHLPFKGPDITTLTSRRHGAGSKLFRIKSNNQLWGNLAMMWPSDHPFPKRKREQKARRSLSPKGGAESATRLAASSLHNS
jgi:hypothetical protein